MEQEQQPKPLAVVIVANIAKTPCLVRPRCRVGLLRGGGSDRQILRMRWSAIEGLCFCGANWSARCDRRWTWGSRAAERGPIASLRNFGECFARMLSNAEGTDLSLKTPLLLLHSRTDPLVPFGQSVEMEQRYRKAGAAVTLRAIDASGVHGFWGDQRYFSDAKRLAIAFLHRNLRAPT